MVYPASPPNHQELQGQRLHGVPAHDDVPLGSEWSALFYLFFRHRRVSSLADPAPTFHILLHGFLGPNSLLSSGADTEASSDSFRWRVLFGDHWP